MNKLLGVISTLILGVEVSASVVHRIAKFSVEPNLQSVLAEGDTFRDSLYITNVVGMYAWQAFVLYDPSVIRWKSHKEGPFMTNVSTTMFLISADTINGEVLVGALFMPPGYPYYTVSGSGSVLYITWQVKSSGKSPIRIRHEDTRLMDTLDNHIPFDTVDGWYNPPGIAIFYPNESDYLKRGNEYAIRWTSGGISPLVKIELWKGGILDSTIASSTQNDCSHIYAIPGDKNPGSDYKLKVKDWVVPVYDSVNLNIYRQIQITSPIAGDTWNPGEVHDITWITSGTNDSVSISYWNGGSQQSVATTPDDGSYSWTIPNTPTVRAKVYINQFNAVNQTESSFFTIDSPFITVISPNGSETWYRGSIDTIKWTSNMTQQNIRIYLYKGSNYSSTIVSGTPNDGSYDWTIPSGQAIGSDYRVKILSNDGSTEDSSDAYFTIAEPGGVDESSKLNPELVSGQSSKLEVYTNPFSRTTEIRIQKTEDRNESDICHLASVICIYDLSGKLVKSFPITQQLNNSMNSITVVWDGSDGSGKLLPSGIYFCKLRVRDKSLTKQLLLLR